MFSVPVLFALFINEMGTSEAGEPIFTHKLTSD